MFFVAVSIFLITYAIIISERIHRTTIALAGAGLLVFLGVITQAQAFESIDFNTIGLLMGMMIIVAITQRTGLFQWAAFMAARLGKGDPKLILIYISLIACVFSMFLANVTTMLLMAPVTIVIANNLKISPIPFLISEMIMINLGGLATLIGDPVNVLIGSASGLSFMQFIVNNGLIVAILVPMAIFMIAFYFRKDLVADEKHKEAIMKIDPKESIRDKKLLIQSLVILFSTLGLFVFSSVLPFTLEAATIALFGAALLLVVTDIHPEKILAELEWTTILFFTGLFILIAGIEHVGLIELMAEKLVDITNGDITLTSLAILWTAGILSGFVDNIPLVATLIPLIQQLGSDGMNITNLWWILSLGAVLGGNATLVGTASNLVGAGVAEKAGYKIGFVDYMKIGGLVTVMSLVVTTAYVFIRYL